MKSVSSSIIHSCLTNFGFEKDKLLKGSGTICRLCKQKVAHGGGMINLKNKVNKAYKLFAISLSETPSSLDTSFWSAEVKSSLLTLLYAIRTLMHATDRR